MLKKIEESIKTLVEIIDLESSLKLGIHNYNFTSRPIQENVSSLQSVAVLTFSLPPKLIGFEEIKTVL